MNKLTADKCREQFEEWFKLNHDSQLITKGDGYSEPINQLMWQTWKASRQALEINMK